ncbi:MAG: HAD-IIA family hydrolase [Anaerolineae bacterium]|nr:HAD-IIA family hydrolase [Anaerolineae bacterium]
MKPKTELDLKTLRAFLLDLDGVVYRGEAALPGAVEFVTALQAQGMPFLFITNNSTRTPAQYVARLARMGVHVGEEAVLTSALATAAYLAELAPPGTPVYVIGETGLRQALAERGFVLSEDHAVARYVVVGHDTALTWHKLAAATLAIRRGAPFIATNPDRTLPTEEGLVPGAGAILAALEAASGVSPQVIGKPESVIFRQALARLGVLPRHAAVVGDRLDTDIHGGQRAGLRTIGLLSGVTTAEEFARANPPPDGLFENLAALLAAWQAAKGER